MSSEFKLAERLLGDVTINHDGKRKPVKESERKKGVYPYYGASGIVDYVDGYIFEGEYLLIAEDGENLRTRQTPIAFMADGKFWVNNHAHIVTGNGEVTTKYLSYFLRNVDIQPYITGAVMPKLTQGNLKKIPVRFPSLNHQNAIVGTLGSLDDKIALNRQINQTLEAMAQAIFKSWFVDFDPVKAKIAAIEAGQDPLRAAMSAISGKNDAELDTMPSLQYDELAATAALFPAELVESELGDVPKGWEVKPIGELVNCLGGSTPDTKNLDFWEPKEYAWTTPKDLSGATSPVLLSTGRKLSKKGLDKIGSGLLPVGTLLMSSRAPIGYLAISQIPVAINQGYIAIPPSDNLSPFFLYFWCQENLDLIKSNANGSTFLEISKKAFNPLLALKPSGDVHQVFFDKVSRIFSQIVTLENQVANLTELRDTLLPKLLSGELSVAELEEVV